MAKRTNIGPFLVFFAAMLWATDAPFRVALLKDLPAELLVLGEHLVNCVLLLPIIIVRRKEFLRLGGREWAALLFIGIGGSAVATFLFTKAFAFVNPSVALLLQKLQPFIAIALARALLKERQGPRFWLWTAVAVAGAYVLTFPGLVPRTYVGETFNPSMAGALLALGAAALWGASTVFGKIALKRLDFTAVTALRFWIALVFLLAWNQLQSGAGVLAALGGIAPRDWGLIAVVALVSGSASLLLYYRGLRTTRASVATIAEMGYPLAAVLVNAFTLDAWLKPMEIVGMCVLLVAVFALSSDSEEEGTRAAAI